MIPGPWQFALLALASYRLWHLLAIDDVLEGPRDRVLDLLSRVEGRVERWEKFLLCPWCAGFWLSGIVYGVWLATLGTPSLAVSLGAVGLGVWLALSAVVAIVAVAVERVVSSPPT